MSFLEELKRRNVIRMAVLYAVAAWLILQVAEVLISLAALPDWLGRAVLAVLAIGFPIALILAWIYEITPKGIAKTSANAAETPASKNVIGRRSKTKSMAWRW